MLTCGLHVMERYRGLLEETTPMLSRGGWLDTRDVGWMAGDGQLWLLGHHKPCDSHSQSIKPSPSSSRTEGTSCHDYPLTSAAPEVVGIDEDILSNQKFVQKIIQNFNPEFHISRNNRETQS